MRKIDIANAQYLNKINRLLIAICTDPDSYYRPRVDFDSDSINQDEKQLVFVLEDSRQVIAYLSLHCEGSFQEDESASFEIGVHPNSWRTGCATELVNYVLQFVKERTKLKRLEIKVAKENQKAKRFFAKLGFQYVNQSHPKGDDMVIDIIR